MHADKNNTSTTKQQQSGPSLQAEEKEQPFFGPAGIQPKLTIGAPDDPYEQEADAMAERVIKQETSLSQNPKTSGSIQTKGDEEKEEVQMKTTQQKEEEQQHVQAKPIIQRMEEVQMKTAEQKEEEKQQLQTKPAIQRKGDDKEELMQAKLNPQQQKEEELKTSSLQMKGNREPSVASSNLETQLQNSKGSGDALAAETNKFMSGAFANDFSQVRVHTGSKAIQMSESIGARAFTHGSDVYFNSGEYSPGSQEGKRLLAHELTHVVQQGANNTLNRKSSSTNDSNTSEEDQNAQGEGETVVQDEEDTLVSQQTVEPKEVKDDHIEHSTGVEPSGSGNNGHLKEWIKERHTIYKDGAVYKARIDEFDVHTQVFIRPKSDSGRWDKIEDFVDYYDTPYSPSYNIYEGTLKHEKQHAVEAANAYNKNAPGFRASVGAISEPTRAAAEAEYQRLFTAFHTAYQADYWANGEVDGYRIEWDYYHSEFEKFVADPVSYGLFDWVIFDREALKVLKILDKLRARKRSAFEKMVNGLKREGVLNNLLDNIGKNDKKTYKSLIAAIYLLL